MKRLAVRFIVLAVFCCPGCARNHYVVEITPRGDRFDRTLTCWTEGGQDPNSVSPLGDEELNRIEKLYQTRTEIEEGKKHLFTGSFRGDMPPDVGGAGSYTYFVTPLGTLSGYVERFRGNDDLEANLARRRAAADQLTDLLIGWFRTELGDGPDFEKIRSFLDEGLRRDLKNLASYAWTAQALAEHQMDVEEEFSVRFSQYLVERDYLTFRELPGAVRAFTDKDPQRLADLIQRLVARKMGVANGRPLPPSLAFLGDPDRLLASLRDHLRTTELYQQRLDAWQQRQSGQEDSEAAPPDPMEVLPDLFLGGVLEFSLAPADSLEVKLHADLSPFATNGDWDPETAAVTWSGSLAPHGALPMVCFAVWSCPNQEAQMSHFGKVVLRDRKLAEYVVWYRGLSANEARQWDRFVDGCKPGAELRAALESFRFTTDPEPGPESPDDEAPPSLADTPRGLILDALQEANEREKDP
jgi:hypothetical protein